MEFCDILAFDNLKGLRYVSEGKVSWKTYAIVETRKKINE